MVSIIIPCLNESGVIQETLQSVCSQLEASDEVLVVDGGSEDHTGDIVRTFPGVRWIEGAGRGRAKQLNRGAVLARGAYLLFLHADTTLSQGALQKMRDILEGRGVIGATFRIRFEPATPLLQFLAGVADLNIGIFTFGDQGLFIRADTFRELGGYRGLPIMEDVDFNHRLRKKGRLKKCPAVISTSSRRFLDKGVGIQLTLNVLLLLAFAIGVSPVFLKRFYPDRAAGNP